MARVTEAMIIEDTKRLLSGYDYNRAFNFFGHVLESGFRGVRKAWVVPGYYLRPNEAELWRLYMKDPKYRRAIKRNRAKAEQSYYGEFIHVATQRTNMTVLTFGPPESGKSTINHSLAHLMRDLYIAFSGGDLIPRIYVTFGYSETLEVLKNPAIARERILPVRSIIFNDQYFPDISEFSITLDELKALDDKKILPRPGDMIVQDEVPKERGMGSLTNLDALKNILKQIRASRINFFFATPAQVKDFLLNIPQEPLGKNYDTKTNLVLYYTYLFAPAGTARVMVYPDEEYQILYDKRKMENIDKLLAQGGSVGAISPEKIENDQKRILEYIEITGEYPTSQTGLLFVMQKIPITGPSTYLNGMARQLWSMYGQEWKRLSQKSYSRREPIEEDEDDIYEPEPEDFEDEEDELEDWAATEIDSDTLLSEVDTAISGEGSVTPTPTAMAIKEGKTPQEETEINNDFSEAEFPYDEVAERILQSEQIIHGANVDWRVVQLAYYYMEILGYSNSKTRKWLKKKLGETVSEKTLSTYRRGEVKYFEQIATSLKTKVGFEYERWTLENYWKKHPDVINAYQYSTDTKIHHQGTPDIILETRKGYKVAVACKVKSPVKGDVHIHSFNETPEWKAYVNGDVHAVILDTYDMELMQSLRKFVLPEEVERSPHVNWRYHNDNTQVEPHIPQLDEFIEQEIIKKEN